MRSSQPALLLFLCSVIPALLVAQQSTPTGTTSGSQTPQAASIIQQSLAAMTGGAPVTDVTMTGTVTVTQNSASSPSSPNQLTTESGTIMLVATAAGQSQISITLPSGNWVTTQNYATNPRTSSVAGPTGTTQDTAPEDSMAPHPAWFCPTLVMAATAPATYVTGYVGQETLNSSLVQHVSIWPQANQDLLTNSFQVPGQQVLTGPGPSYPIHLGQEDLYVDTSSILPQAIVLRTRGYKWTANGPDPTQPVSSEERVEFSNYQQVQGRFVALHIQVVLATVPILNIQLSSVTFNTGVQIASN